MAIDEFKNIIDKKGYKLDEKDRKIFERELQKTLFGSGNTDWKIFGNTDMIEFVLYDSNENKLPQGDSGDYVRYIYLDDANINKYFLIKPETSTISGQPNSSPEYLVDTQLLIKEAGYSNGIFKTQVTLLNRRAGSEKIQYDRMWIHEIAPSRTEIRVLPVKDKDDNVLPDLQQRYDIFVNNGNFRDDTASMVQRFVESIDIQKVFEAFLKLKGHVDDGYTYIDLIKDEFKIAEFEVFLNNIKETFIQSMRYFVENRDWNINSLTYGNPLFTIPSLNLSKEEICTVTSTVLADTIDYLLPRRNILENSTLSMEDQITFDELQDILKTLTSDNIYDSTLPTSVYAPVYGCMDVNALNFNPSATIDNGTCIYTKTDDDVIINDPVDPITPINITTTTFYVWSATGTMTYIDTAGVQQTITEIEYGMFTITYSKIVNSVGDIRTYPKPKPELIIKCNDPKASNYGEIGKCIYSTTPKACIDSSTGEIIYNGFTWNSTLTITALPLCPEQ